MLILVTFDMNYRAWVPQVLSNILNHCGVKWSICKYLRESQLLLASLDVRV